MEADPGIEELLTLCEKLNARCDTLHDALHIMRVLLDSFSRRIMYLEQALQATEGE